nr:phosphoribosylanthranilate isomerase [Pseudalkalibacillus caeni]
MLDTKLKFCGNASYEDYQAVLESAADYVGLIFANSRREVKPETAGSWFNELGKGCKKLVGVFVNPTLGEIERVLKAVPLDVIQLHGSESPEFAGKVKDRFSLQVWKAIHHSDRSIEQMKNYESIVDGYVVDNRTKDKWGGTGKRFDWQQIPFYLEEAEVQQVPLFIAGGIKPENIERLMAFHPYGIDLSSGIETNGRKDIYKMKRIIERMKKNGDTSTG